MPIADYRKYATATSGGSNVRMSLTKQGVTDLAASGDWSPAAGDVKVSIDDGAEANIGTLPTYTNGKWVFIFAGAELTGKSIHVRIVDQTAPKVINDDWIVVGTFGHASALVPQDYSEANQAANVKAISDDTTAADNLESYTDGTTPMPVNATQISGDGPAADNAEAFFDGTGYAGTNNVIPTVTTATNVTTVNGLAANVITAAALADDAADEIRNVVYELTGPALTNLASALTSVIHDAQADGGTTTSVTIGGASSSVDNFYRGCDIRCSAGDLSGQKRTIIAYDGTTKVATVDREWTTAATSSMEFKILSANSAKLDSSLRVTGLDSGGNAYTAGVIAAGGITSSSFAAGAITAAAIATDAITAAKLAADAAAEIAAAVETAILNEADLSAVLEAIRLKIEESDDDLTTTLIRDAILNRVLPGNHDTSNSVGAFIQKLDALVGSRMATFSVPTNFSTLGINASGHISRVTLVDTVTSGGGGGASASDIWTYGMRVLTGPPPYLIGSQQHQHRVIVKGNSYSATSRPFAVGITNGGEWPIDLSLWTWTFTADKHPDNDNTGSASISGTVAVTTATGASRALSVSITAAVTGGMAVGLYMHSVRGTLISDSTQKWSVELGVIEVKDDAAL